MGEERAVSVTNISIQGKQVVNITSQIPRSKLWNIESAMVLMAAGYLHLE